MRRHRPTYPELQQQVAALTRQRDAMRLENEGLTRLVGAFLILTALVPGVPAGAHAAGRSGVSAHRPGGHVPTCPAPWVVVLAP